MRRWPIAVLAAGLLMGSLSGCGGDDGSSEADTVVRRLPDPCRLLSVSQLRRDLDQEFLLRPPAPDASEPSAYELACSWISVDEDTEQDEDFLEEPVNGFIDIVVRRSDPDTGFDAAEFFDEMTIGPDAQERSELLATEEKPTLGDAAVSVGPALYVRKGDVVLTVLTADVAALDDLIPEAVERVIRRL